MVTFFNLICIHVIFKHLRARVSLYFDEMVKKKKKRKDYSFLYVMSQTIWKHIPSIIKKIGTYNEKKKKN